MKGENSCAYFACSLEGNKLNDLYEFDPVTASWSDLTWTASGNPPSPRAEFGFTSCGGKLFVHGGYGEGMKLTS